MHLKIGAKEMDISIVTSCYNGYDRYLPRWIDSICKGISKPRQVVVIAVEADLRNLEYVIEKAVEHNIRYHIAETTSAKAMGVLRNKAVEAATQEWIMYLDVDDEILPGALVDINKYKDKADVIVGGLLIKRKGKMSVKKFLHASNQAVLNGRHCSSSHGIYRKSFWKKAPYHEYNDWCEQPFWIGLAYAKARFIGIPEVCTIYNRSETGHNLSMTKEDKKRAKRQRERMLKQGFIKEGDDNV